MRRLFVPSRKKLTPAFVADVHARKRAGLSARQIAKEKGVSRQTIDRALDAAPTSTKVTVTSKRPSKVAQTVAQNAEVAQKTTPATGPSTPADLDELRTLMAELARGLTAQAREAREDDDAGAYMALASKAKDAVLALAKLSPAAPQAEHEGFYVTTEDMAKTAAEVRAKILERVARRAKGAA